MNIDNDYVEQALNYFKELIHEVEIESGVDLKNAKIILAEAYSQHRNLLNNLDRLIKLNLKSANVINVRSKQKYKDLKDPNKDNLDN